MKSIFRSNSIRSVTTEVFSIVIGVLLALAVNEWNENRVHKERADEAIKNIIQEIEGNIKFLQLVNKNNSMVVDLLKQNQEPDEEDNQLNFVPGLQIQDTAWKTLLSTGVSEYIDYSTLYEISSVYSMQEIYKTLGYQMVQSMTNNNALLASLNPENTPAAKNDLFIDNMVLLVEVEKAILGKYDKAKEKLENNSVE